MKKYNYQIKEIERLVNQGNSIIKTAEKLGYCPKATHAWIDRNFIRSVTYHPKFKKWK